MALVIVLRFEVFVQTVLVLSGLAIWLFPNMGVCQEIATISMFRNFNGVNDEKPIGL